MNMESEYLIMEANAGEASPLWLALRPPAKSVEINTPVPEQPRRSSLATPASRVCLSNPSSTSTQ
jgi:hypothetical protein